MRNNDAIQKSIEIILGGVILDVEIYHGGEKDGIIGPIYELKYYRLMSDHIITARLFRKIYIKRNNDWDKDEHLIKEFDTKRIIRDHKIDDLLNNSKN